MYISILMSNILSSINNFQQIPVTNAAIFKLNSNHLTNGFKPCNLVYNFYPVDENIVLIADGEFIYKTYTRLLAKPFNRSY